ncbi:helix-turn-helix transcriptional regulator [Brevundimonas intermedia]|uniref:helix-turn-helix transcriptional regulator n=1 Tax=Brevundimonas intermedia TaxID=74315 RepID=UPI003209E484
MSGGPEDRLLPWDRVHDITGISRSTAWRMSLAGAFPSRVSVSPGRVGWWESELTAWKALRGAAPAIDPPAKTARSKGLEPPARPRLPGMSRPAPMREVSAGRSPSQPELPMEPVSKPGPDRKRRRTGSSALDQIDFGF